MSKSALADLRILVVEDNPMIRQDVRRCFRLIPEATRQLYGIGDFMIDEAGSVAESTRLLEQANQRAYDLVLLDLHLPHDESRDVPGSLQNGLNLLRFVTESQTAAGIIIISAFNDYNSVIQCLRGGALDFVPKPFFQDSLEPAILNTWTLAMTQRSREILYQRVWNLAAYAEKGLAHSFKIVFSKLLQGVSAAAASIQNYADERYGVDSVKDSDDALMMELRSHQAAINQARQDWARLQSELAAGSGAVESGHVEQILHALKESLLPCLVVKKVVLDLAVFEERPILTFEGDVEIVLREIMVGLLSELPDYGQGRRVNISFAIEGTRARVRFEDDLDPVPEEKIKAINEGQRILPDREFGRAWGLSVAQHVALRGGGELVVSAESGGNVITYFIPLAD